MSYASHGLKDIFNVQRLDLKSVAQGFGFEVPPPMNLDFVKNSGMRGLDQQFIVL